MAHKNSRRRRRRASWLPLALIVLMLACGIGLIAFVVTTMSEDAPALPETTGGQTTTLPSESTAPQTEPPVTTVPEETEPQPTEDPVPEMTATMAVVADGPSGKILYTRGDLHTKVYPASVTKLFSAFVAMQYL